MRPIAILLATELDDDGDLVTGCDGDCDDADPDNWTGNVEQCDGQDNDCDGLLSPLEIDDDGDGQTECDGDCDDADPANLNFGVEICDGQDNDCDGLVSGDEIDDDGDGQTECDGDCDDIDPANFDGNPEVCDGADTDCDPASEAAGGEVDGDGDGALGCADCDDGDPAWIDTEYFGDGDGDGFGDPAVSLFDCAPPSGFVDNADDCDDSDPALFPGSDAACAALDCLELLNQGNTADGDYWVTMDGVPTLAECDMSGGGWTLVFFDDFEATPDAGWSMSATYVCGPWTTLLGGYGNLSGGAVSNVVALAGVEHAEVRLDLSYAKLDSWDGETAYVDLGGQNLWTASLQYYEGSEVCGWNRGWDGSYDDLHLVTGTLAHSDPTVEVVAGSTLDQDASDESFGIDDVAVWVR
jgi:hypothetical protein